MTKSITFEPFEPEFGPPKPVACVEGPESHEWRLSIEEGTVGLSCDCRLCSDGLAAYAYPEDFEMSEIPVSLVCHHERTYDGDSLVYWEAVPS